MVSREEQLQKVYGLIDETNLGIEIERMLSQLQKAEDPICITFPLIETACIRLSTSSKALSPIVVTFSPTLIVTSDLLPLKALGPIEMTYSGIVTSVEVPEYDTKMDSSKERIAPSCALNAVFESSIVTCFWASL